MSDLDSLLIMTGELGFEGGGSDGIHSGYTVPVMAALGSAYGEEDRSGNQPWSPQTGGTPSANQVLEFIQNMTGALAPAITQAVATATGANGQVNLNTLMAGLGQQQSAAQAGSGQAGGMSATELMAIMQLLNPPKPEPTATHPAVLASIGIGVVSVFMLIAALLMGRGGRRSVQHGRWAA